MNCVGHRALGLCVPPLLLCLLDGGLTLSGQASEYWAGNYERVNEGSPTFNQLRKVHPAAFAAGLGLWAALFVALILLLPNVLALITSIAVTVGHTMGSATWILYRFHFGYQACNALVAVSSILLGLGIWYGWRAAPSEPYRLPGLSMKARWAIAAALIAVAVYLFLWPR